MGDKLYVTRQWPAELVAFDIADPDQPREINYWSSDHQGRSIQILDGRLYATSWGAATSGRMTDYGLLEDVQYWNVPSELNRGNAVREYHLANGHFYALFGRSLLVFPPVAKKGESI